MPRRRRKTLHVRLPELSPPAWAERRRSPREAAALTYLLNELDTALWAAYGHKMLALCENEGIPRILTDSEIEQSTDKKRGR